MTELNKEIEQCFIDAEKIANTHNHKYLVPEHLLAAICQHTTFIEFAKSIRLSSVKQSSLNAELVLFFSDPSLCPTIAKNAPNPNLLYTTSVHRLAHRMVLFASKQNREITVMHLLLSLLEEEKSTAVFLLNHFEISKAQISTFISEKKYPSDLGSSKTSKGNLPDEMIEKYLKTGGQKASQGKAASQAKNDDEEGNALQQYTRNLNEEAMSGYIDKAIGRQDEVDRILQILMRRRKNNPIIVGDPGVGKTTLIDGLAHKIVDGDVPEDFADSCIYSLNLMDLIAGTRYRGDFEERLSELLACLREEPNSILFIDEMQMMMGAGAGKESPVDAATMLKPYLTRGDIKCIGSLTFDDYQNTFQKDRALARRFQKVEVNEPSLELAEKILLGVGESLAKHHKIKYQPKVFKHAVALSDRYLRDLMLPDKAIDILDEAASRVRFSTKRKTVTIQDIEQTVAFMSKLPLEKISMKATDRLKNLAKELKAAVFGHDLAVKQISDTVLLSQAGLRDEKKPIGCFLFTGPTGVGKTEMAKQLAKSMDVPLLRFDMSEYMEKHNVSRFVGSPPGYVGYNEGGQLTKAVSKSPYCILLLDEIEKAHPDVTNLLLQVMDNGTMTDGSGKQTSFRNLVLIMTSNVGASETSRRGLGFNNGTHQSEYADAVEKFFAPEFRNRLDAVVTFPALASENIDLVTRKFIAEIQKKIESRNISINVEDAMVSWLSANGFDDRMGARPIQRIVDKYIQEPLAQLILKKQVKEKEVIRISLEKGTICFYVNTNKKPIFKQVVETSSTSTFS